VRFRKVKLKNRTKILLTTLFVVGILASSMTALTSALPASTVAAKAAGTGMALPPEVEQLKAQIPATLAQAEAQVLPVRGTYLMWTCDLQHIMWGRFGARYFVGTDNLGKQAWGIYGRGYFAGFYDGQFFWGRYSNGNWKAQGLFGLNAAYGNYVTYPIPVPTTSATPK
jgi:hypothetical protein